MLFKKKQTEKYLTCKEIAESTGFKIRAVWNWIREGKLKAVNLPCRDRYRVKESDLEEFMTKNFTRRGNSRLSPHRKS